MKKNIIIGLLLILVLSGSDKEVAIINVVEIEIKYYEKVGLLFIIHDIFPDNCNHTRI